MDDTERFPPGNPKGYARFRLLYSAVMAVALINLVGHIAFSLLLDDSRVPVSFMISIRIVVIAGAALFVSTVFLEIFRWIRGGARRQPRGEGAPRISAWVWVSFAFLGTGCVFSFSDIMIGKAAGDGMLWLMLSCHAILVPSVIVMLLMRILEPDFPRFGKS